MSFPIRHDLKIEPVSYDIPPLVATVDVEEWYHTCLISEYVDPKRRPRLAKELDWLLPHVLDVFQEARVLGTFFVLGEVAEENPGRIREIAEAGHEVACHGFHHFRVGQYDHREFRRDVSDSKALLEDLVGQPVNGYRAPEWSLRSVHNPLLRLLPELGFEYDCSLTFSPGSGRPDNPRQASRISWNDHSLYEFPPLAWGPWDLPANGWTARGFPPSHILGSVARHRAAGGLPVLVLHPWELSPRMTPGDLRGLANWMHELGRHDFLPKVKQILRAGPWQSIRQILELGTVEGGS